MYVSSRRTSFQQRAEVSGGNKRRHRPDYMLTVLVAALTVMGLIVVFSISPALSAQKNVAENYFVVRQAIAVILSAIVFLIVANVPLAGWRRLERPLIITAAVASVAVRLFGEQVNGAYRWIQVGGMSFQPAELIKFSLLVWLAAFLADRIRSGTLGDWQKSIKPLLIVFAIIGFVVAVLQSDLGSTAVMVAMMGMMAFVAGLPMKRLLMIGGVVTAAVVLVISATPYRRERLRTFLNPAADCQASGYQTCQALIAVGSGGIFGLGLARSVQAYGYLPEAANDSIFAIFAEKFGFVGSTFLVGLFIALYTRLLRIAERCPDDYTRLIVVGVLTWLSAQSLINMGAMIGLLPLKGITLPFISYGGTSLIFVTAAVALVFNISRYTSFRISSASNKGASYDNSIGRRGDRRAYNAPVSRRP